MTRKSFFPLVSIKWLAANLVLFLLVFNLTAAAQSSPRTVLLVADNQQHMLTGSPLLPMSTPVDYLFSSVAVRSPLLNIGGNSLFRQALESGKNQGAELAIHLGDASDISCPDELTTTFDSLQSQFGDGWFTSLGNHDGLLAGTFAKKLLPDYDFTIPENFYSQPPSKKLKEGRWLHGCLSPRNIDTLRADILTKGDAIRMYMDRLRSRTRIGAKWRRIRVEEVTVPHLFRKVAVNCEVEEVTIDSLKYRAVARICPRTRVSAGSRKWVGPTASYLVQKVGLSDVTLVLIDTSTYDPLKPLDVDMRKFDLHIKGNLSPSLRAEAEKMLAGENRDSVIMAGHHPFDLIDNGQDWIASKTNRYISGHVHRQTQLVDYEEMRLRDLNIGSVLDYPTQTVLLEIQGRAVYYSLLGAESTARDFVQTCENKEAEWTLTPAFYSKRYRDKSYVKELIDALQRAAKKYNEQLPAGDSPIEIPTGQQRDDWADLDEIFQRISTSSDPLQQFWACQAFYASKATRHEMSWVERLMNERNIGPRSGVPTKGAREAFIGY